MTMRRRLAALALSSLGLRVVTPAFSCYKAAAYGTFQIGVFGFGNEVVGGDRIGSDNKITNDEQWDFNGNHYISSCSHHANFNSSVATGKWPDHRVEIQTFFQREENRCANYSIMVHDRFSGNICD